MSTDGDWLSSWDSGVHIFAAAAFFYVVIVLLVRVLGKRTTSQMNNFDWIITIAVGSLAASGILLQNVAVSEALVAIGTLGFLQWATTKLVLKSHLFAAMVKAQPTLLVHKGEFITEAMQAARISEEEIWSALRANGLKNAEDANWVILETNGDLTVIPKADIALDEAATMQTVSVPDRLRS